MTSKNIYESGLAPNKILLNDETWFHCYDEDYGRVQFVEDLHNEAHSWFGNGGWIHAIHQAQETGPMSYSGMFWLKVPSVNLLLAKDAFVSHAGKMELPGEAVKIEIFYKGASVPKHSFLQCTAHQALPAEPSPAGFELVYWSFIGYEGLYTRSKRNGEKEEEE